MNQKMKGEMAERAGIPEEATQAGEGCGLELWQLISTRIFIQDKARRL